MTIFEKNLHSLKVAYPALYERTLNYSLPEHYQIVAAKNNEINISVSKQGKTYNIHSDYYPSDDARCWCQAVDSEGSDILIIYGLGLAYHLETMVNTYPNAQIVVIEPDINIFYILLRTTDITALILNNSKVSLVVSNDYLEIMKQINQSVNIIGCGLSLHVYSGYLGLYAQEINEFKKIFKKVLITTGMNLITVVGYRNKWLENFFGNLVKIITKPYVSLLFKKCNQVPAIIVGAGPSVDKNMELLRQAKGRSIIFAAGTTYQVLAKNGIEPDFAVAIDANKENQLVFEGVEAYKGRFVFSPQFYWETNRRINAKSFVMPTASDEYLQWFNTSMELNEKNLYTGPSVSNVCMHLAYEMGCNPIILVGQDLCYTNNRMHADGHSIQDDPASLPFNMIKTTNIYGQEVNTRRAFLVIKEYFENFAANVGRERTYLNATEGGLNIEGIANVKLAEVIQQFCVNDVTSLFKELDTLYAGFLEARNHERQDYFTKAENIFCTLRSECADILVWAEEAIKIALTITQKFAVGQAVADDMVSLEQLEKKVTATVAYTNFLSFGLKDIINVISSKTTADINRASSESERVSIIQKAYVSEMNEIIQYTADVQKMIDIFLYELTLLKED